MSVIAVAAAVLAGTQPAEAGLTTNTIGANGVLAGHGRTVEVDALLGCTTGQQSTIEVTLTQGQAYGRGQSHGACTGEVAAYPVRVTARGPHDFVAGPADACALAVNTDRGTVDDTRQWCRAEPVTLTQTAP